MAKKSKVNKVKQKALKVRYDKVNKCKDRLLTAFDKVDEGLRELVDEIKKAFPEKLD